MARRIFLLSIAMAIIVMAIAPTTGAVNWTRETVDSYGDVGKCSSLALDKNGWPHISYHDHNDYALKYAYKDSLGWHRTTVHAPRNVGYQTSIALDDLGHPHITHYKIWYWDYNFDNLEYSYEDNLGWHTESVDEYGDVGRFSAIALDSNGYPHIAYYGDYDGNKRLKYAYKDDLGWHIRTLDSFVGAQATSTKFGIAIDSYNRVHIVYFDEGNLGYFCIAGSGMYHDVIEYGCGQGVGASIVLDNNNYPHVSYQNQNNAELKYAYQDASGWHTITVDSDNNTGYSSSIALDSNGHPHISYIDDTQHYLKYAWEYESGWHIQTVESYYNVGSYYQTSLALNAADEPHISYFNATNADLMLARPQSYGPGSFGLRSPGNGSWAKPSPTFHWEACSYQGDSLSRYELWIDGMWAKNAPKTQTCAMPNVTLTSGWHTWRVLSLKVDGDSIWSSETWSVRIDATPPSAFSPLTPADNMWTNNGIPTFTWRASSDAESGLEEYQLFIDGSPVRTGIPPDSTSTTPLWYLSDGDHIWHIRAVDNVSNTTQSNPEWTVRIDRSYPNYFYPYYPLNHSYTTDTLLTFKWQSTTDAGIGMSHYQLWINGITQIDSIPADTSVDTMSVTLDTSRTLTHGSYHWNIKAFDKLGNSRLSATWYLYVDLRPPYSFSLVSPTDSSLIPLPTPDFTWHSTSDYAPVSSGFSKYQLWIDSSVNVDNLTDPSDTSTAPSGPLSEGYHDWFVKAYDNLGNVRSSNETRTVILDWNLPEAFSLSSPHDEDTVVTDRPTFYWHPSYDAGSGIQKYQLWIGGVLNRDNISPEDTCATPLDSLANGSYPWFVKAYDGAGGVVSSNETWHIVVSKDLIPPSVPQLASPRNNSFIQESSPTFVWHASTDNVGVDHNVLQYSVDISFAETTSVEVPDTTHNFSSPFADSQYYWRVKAVDKGNNYSDWSAIWNFTVDTGTPDIPVLNSPADSSWINDNTPTFIWSEVTKIGGSSKRNDRLSILGKSRDGSPVMYRLEYALDASFTQGLVSKDSLLENYYPIPGDQALLDTTYFWHVKAFDQAGNQGSYQAQPSCFTIDTQPPGIPILISPVNSIVTSDTIVEFIWHSTVKEGTHYTLQCAQDSFFIQLVIDTLELTDTTFISSFTDNLNYYWHVEAVDLANNHSGYQASPFNFTIDTQPPNFSKTTSWPDTSLAGPFPIMSTITDSSGVSSCSLYYKTSLDTIWTSISMDTTGTPHQYLAEIPEQGQSDTKIYYYLKAEDGATPPNISTDPLTVPDSVYSFIARFTGVGETKEVFLPKFFSLSQNYPNPFNPVTEIKYTLPRDGYVRLDIFNISGQKIATLVDEEQRVGYKSVRWDAGSFSSGIYFYRLKAGDFTKTRKMILLK